MAPHRPWRVRCAALIIAWLAFDAQALPCVILLHGLARSEQSMAPLAEALATAGYHTVNLGYPSREQTVEELARAAIEPALLQCGADREVSFVTHSLGGILVRHYLKTVVVPKLQRVVMLGPPNQGSEVVDKLGVFPGFEWLNGPAGLQLGTGETSLPRRLGPVTYPVGVIAGNRTFNPILSQMLPDPDDGKVSVASTRVDGMTDHLELPVTHTFMMRNKEVIRQVLAFLDTGRFARSVQSRDDRQKPPAALSP